MAMEVETEIVPFLRQVEIFQSLPASTREELARQVSERRFAAGEPIVRRGEPGDCMFVVVDGMVEVPVRDPDGREELFTARIGSRGIFGEIALLTGEARSADVVAATDCHCLVLAREDVTRLIREHVEVARLLTAILGERLLRSGSIRRVGKYKLAGELGRGGMAIVYEGIHPTLERVVAVKMLSHEKVWAPGFLERFRNEARLISRLRHPSIVEVYDTEEAYGTLFLVMERLPGLSLDQVLAKRGPLAPGEVREILRQLAEALRFAHDQGIVHRDVKPSNVALAGDGRVKLMDFGIAIDLELADPEETAAGAGTPLYMAPEQARGEPVDGRSDVYALGIVAYEMLTGERPFTGKVFEILLHHDKTPCPSPRLFDPTIPEDLESFVLRATEKRPADRFQSCEEILAHFGRFPESSPSCRTFTLEVEPGRERAAESFLAEMRERAASLGLQLR